MLGKMIKGEVDDSTEEAPRLYLSAMNMLGSPRKEREKEPSPGGMMVKSPSSNKIFLPVPDLKPKDNRRAGTASMEDGMKVLGKKIKLKDGT